MKIALIFPPYTHKIFSENLAAVDEEFCLAPPIILAYVAAILEKHGHKVILLDARTLNLSKEEVLERLENFKPQLLGFRAETYHFHDSLDWINYLKSHLNIPVITGGPNLSLYPQETFAHREIDYGVIGEAIESLPLLVRALENGESLRDLAGIVYRDGQETRINQSSRHNIDFDSYPFPARHLLPNGKYHSFLSQKRNFTIMLTSTGCPFHCSFCAISPNSIYRERSPRNVADEIEVCYKDFNIREIDFFDAVMFVNKKRCLAIFDEIRKRKLKIEWSCRSRVDVVDKDILREASRAGCRQIYYGIESQDPLILRALKKEVSIEQIKKAIAWSKDSGIRTLGFFMIGNPGETVESIERNIAFAKDLGLDFVQVCRLIAKPGTELDKTLIKETGRDYWREHVSGKKISGRLPALGTSLSEKNLENLTRKFYVNFYLRPGIIARRILHLKSLREFLRYVRVALRMLANKGEL